MTSQIAKWGNSLALRIPQAVARRAGLSEGAKVELTIAEDNSLVVTPAKPKYTLEELVAGITPANRHPEIDWGPAVGKERW